jgi:hypothetical protein
MGLAGPQVARVFIAVSVVTGSLGVLVASGALHAPTVLVGALAAGVIAVWLFLRVSVYPATASHSVLPPVEAPIA